MYLLICVEVRHLKKFTLYIENAKLQDLLRCCSFKCITKLKIICDEEPSISSQNVKKPAEYSFFKEVIGQPTVVLLKIRILHDLQYDQWFLMAKHVIIKKIGIVVICLLLTNTIFVVINIFNWSVFMVFRREGIFNSPYSRRWYNFSHFFSLLVMDPPGILFVASITV